MRNSKTLCVITALAIFMSATYTDAGILFGEGGLFQQMRVNRMARVSARMQARSASYGSSGGSGAYVVTSYSYGSSGGANSYGSSGSEGRYEAVPATQSYGSSGGVSQYRTVRPVFSRPVFRSGSYCPSCSAANTPAVKVAAPIVAEVSVNPNCDCENCTCGDNCQCGNTSLAGVVAPIVEEETSLAGTKAPEVKEQTSYASL